MDSKSPHFALKIVIPSKFRTFSAILFIREVYIYKLPGKTNYIVTQVEVVILTANGQPRNSTLIKDLNSRGFKTKIIFGIRPSQVKAKLIIPSSRPGLMKRKLQQTEICALITHRRGQEYANKSPLQCVIVEDDTELGPDFIPDRISRILHIVSQQTIPIIATFYFDRWTITSRQLTSGGFYKSLLIPPTGAVCYIPNAKALNLMLNSRVDGSLPADWPAVCRQIDFWMYPGDYVRLGKEFESEVGERNKDYESISLRDCITTAFSFPKEFVLYRILYPIFIKLK